MHRFNSELAKTVVILNKPRGTVRSWFQSGQNMKRKTSFPEGWTPHVKVVGMPFVSLRGVGCSGQNAIIFSREGLV